MLQIFCQFVTGLLILYMCSFDIAVQATRPEVWSSAHAQPSNKHQINRDFCISYSPWKTSRKSLLDQHLDWGWVRGCVYQVGPSSPWHPSVAVGSSRKVAFLLPFKTHLRAKPNSNLSN